MTTTTDPLLPSPLYLVATIRPLPHRCEEALAALQGLRTASLAEDGCELYDLVERPGSPGTWLMLEKWSSRAHWDAHMLSEHNAAASAQLAQLVVEPITLDFYDPVEAPAGSTAEERSLHT